MKSFTNVSIALALAGFTSVALAQPAKKEEAKKPEPPKAEPAKKMEAPKPAPELVEMTKVWTGTWKCTGKAAMDPTKPTEMSDMKMTMKMAADKGMGGMWIVGNLDSPMFKGMMHVTYDAVAKKYYSIMVDSWGGSQTMWSAGAKDNKMMWEGDARMPMPGMSAVKMRETHDMTDMKAGMKMKGEMSMDGKTWMTGWEATCKK